MKKYVELFKSDYKQLLKIRPGITDPASIIYSDEEKVLASSNNWEVDYINVVLPEKVRLAREYADNKITVLKDIKIIIQTLFKIR